MKITNEQLRQIIAEETKAELSESGHTDVASATRQLMTIIEDAGQMLEILQAAAPEGDLPSWWMKKINLSSAYLNGARDYLLTDDGADGTMMTTDTKELKKALNEELGKVLKEQTEPRWKGFLSSVKQWAAKLKYALDDNIAIKLAKYADQRDIAIHQVGDLVKAWIEQHPQQKTAPSGEGEWTRGSGKKEKCMRMCKGETSMHACMQRNCPEFVS